MLTAQAKLGNLAGAYGSKMIPTHTYYTNSLWRPSSFSLRDTTKIRHFSSPPILTQTYLSHSQGSWRPQPTWPHVNPDGILVSVPNVSRSAKDDRIFSGLAIYFPGFAFSFQAFVGRLDFLNSVTIAHTVRTPFRTVQKPWFLIRFPNGNTIANLVVSFPSCFAP